MLERRNLTFREEKAADEFKISELQQALGTGEARIIELDNQIAALERTHRRFREEKSALLRDREATISELQRVVEATKNRNTELSNNNEGMRASHQTLREQHQSPLSRLQRDLETSKTRNAEIVDEVQAMQQSSLELDDLRRFIMGTALSDVTFAKLLEFMRSSQPISMNDPRFLAQQAVIKLELAQSPTDFEVAELKHIFEWLLPFPKTFSELLRSIAQYMLHDQTNARWVFEKILE